MRLHIERAVGRISQSASPFPFPDVLSPAVPETNSSPLAKQAQIETPLPPILDENEPQPDHMVLPPATLQIEPKLVAPPLPIAPELGLTIQLQTITPWLVNVDVAIKNDMVLVTSTCCDKTCRCSQIHFGCATSSKNEHGLLNSVSIKTENCRGTMMKLGRLFTWDPTTKQILNELRAMPNFHRGN